MKKDAHLRNPQSIRIRKIIKSVTATLFLLLVIPLSAQIIYQGPNNGVIFQNVNIGSSSTSWTSVQNAQYPDGILTTAGPLDQSDNFTDYLMATQFSFTIPSEMTISGIEIIFTRSSTKLAQTRDFRVRIVQNGVISSFNHSNSTPWIVQSNPATYGSNGDLWGETWTPAEINSSGFGIAFAARKMGGGQGLTVFIDHIQIKVYYYDSSGTTYSSGTSGASLRTVSLKGTIAQEQLPVFSVFPNPSDGSFISIRFEEPPPCDVLVALYDIFGREEYAKVTINANTSFAEAIGCTKKLAPGIYLITATSKDNFYRKKIVVK